MMTIVSIPYEKNKWNGHPTKHTPLTLADKHDYVGAIVYAQKHDYAPANSENQDN